MQGVIRQYYQGTGWITGDDGNDYFMHYRNLVMKERLYKRGCVVTFDTEDQGGKHLCAVNVTVVPRNTQRERTGHGRWVGTNIRGRFRCTDCNATTDIGKSRFCPHCGALMINSLLPNTAEDNDEEIARASGEHYWNGLEYGYRCSNCHTVSRFPSKFCCRCGKRMQKEVRNEMTMGGNADAV